MSLEDLSPCSREGNHTGSENDSPCTATLFLAIALSGVLLDYGISVVSKFLTRRSLRKEIPEELKGIYDQAKYEKSQAYTKDKLRLFFFSGTFDVAVSLAFWFGGGFGWLDDTLRDIPVLEEKVLVRGSLYIVILSVAASILDFPFTLYITFVLEEKYGFNKTTWRTFLKDLAKGTLVGIVLGYPILVAILAFFEFAGDLGWLYLYIFIVGINLLLLFLMPIFGLRLFFKLKPLEEGELRSAILELAKKAEFSMKDVYVIDGSTRSSHSNAFFTGFGSSKRICLFDTLIEQQSTEEIVQS